MIQIDKPMPDGCDVCPLMYDYIQCNALPEGCEDDDDFNNYEFDWTKRPDWCPLKEIVRCKDCIHRGKAEKCVLAAISEEKSFPLFMLDNRGEWFCADGIRKEAST